MYIVQFITMEIDTFVLWLSIFFLKLFNFKQQTLRFSYRGAAINNILPQPIYTGLNL